jgi:hypothetical protein
MPLSARAVSRSLISLLFAASLLFATSASAGSLRGVIVDPDARPVAGAEVRVIGPTGVRSARTDTQRPIEITDLKTPS